MRARNDIAFGLLCELIEVSDVLLPPDAARYSGQMQAYRHLADLGALGLGDGAAGGILCPWCGGGNLDELHFDTGRHKGYCADCGWVALEAEQVKPYRLDVARVVRWLSSALGLAGRYHPEERVPGGLWRLGEIEHRRKRRTVFFGRRLADPALAPLIEHHLRIACAPGCGVVITTTSDAADAYRSAGHLVIALRAVARLRKAGFIVENLDAYLDGTPVAGETSSETSLRLMHSGRVVLIGGVQHRLSPQVYGFLSVLEEAAGDPVHKRTLADALEIDVDKCKGGDIFKRHKEVYRTFVAHDQTGHYRLCADFIPMTKRR